jgi:hypothetical protein
MMKEDVYVYGVRLPEATNGPIVHPPGDMSSESHGGMMLTEENLRTPRNTCPVAIFFTANLTLTDSGANPVLCDERPATNRLTAPHSNQNGCFAL